MRTYVLGCFSYLGWNTREKHFPARCSGGLWVNNGETIVAEQKSKQAHEIYFFSLKVYSIRFFFIFNNMLADQTNSPQQLAMMQLDKKLNFEKHLSKVESKVNKIIGINCRLQHGQTPRSALLTIYE